MPGAVSGGEPVPEDGGLPASAMAALGARPFAIYVHVPFCTTRCGYCDFNTYTAGELATRAEGGAGPAGAGPAVNGGVVSAANYADLAIAEIGFARQVIGAADLPVRTVFFGGGTPTLLAPSAIGDVLRAIGTRFGFGNGLVEVTTEANPESVTPESLRELRAQGVSRVSFGMQSAVPAVLRTLDRVHQPGRPAQCVRWAYDAGFEHVSLDLIYGTPGETDADWKCSVNAAIDAEPDHISAYALTVEPGTRLAARVRRGEVPAPDDDVLAARYAIADDLLSGAGYRWYEISNWARDDAARCAHNMLYWTGADWWGVGPGAHSHVGGTRWWNVRHPAAYAERIRAGISPGQAREILTEGDKRLEDIMLRTRLADGYPVDLLDNSKIVGVLADGLARREQGRLMLTRRGRLLADTVVRALT